MNWMLVTTTAVSLIFLFNCHRPPGQDSASLKPALPAIPAAVTTHPRLFLRESDLSRLRGWAVSTNSIYENGLNSIAKESVQKLNEGIIPKEDRGDPGYSEYPTESYAMLFAFLSLIAPTPVERDDHAGRARSLLMHAISHAEKGVSGDRPFRDPHFSVGDRSRWSGAAFPLTVDWIYGYLSAEDKQRIRKVFLRWADDLERAGTTDYNHPEPFGLTNDPRLTADIKRVRWSANNYYCAHARNLGLMAMAFDAEDDPGGLLRHHLYSVAGAWLYVSDALWRGDMRGGLPPEGFEYSPQAVGYIAQLLLAFHTAGLADSASFGKQVTFGNPFWEEFIPGYYHSLSPVAKTPEDPNYSYLGQLHSVAWYGDGQKFWAPDFMAVFGPLGLYHSAAGDAKRLAEIRWIQTHLAPGGATKLAARAGDRNDLLDAIFYFLLFDPKAAPTADPRPAYPLSHFSKGLGRFLQRTSWTESASWFSYKLGWTGIDHQLADGNMFELWRRGEWLTKERTGYGDDLACTDQKNGVTIQNDPTAHDHEYLRAQTMRGSQRTHDADGDGKILAASYGPDFSYFLGDATQLYNSTAEGSTDVLHASRSIVWLPPDHIVVYDRAASKSPDRFKRFLLQLPNAASVAQNLMTMRTSGGQAFYVRTLLPEPAAIAVEPVEPLDDERGKQPAELDPIRFRLRVEAPGHPKVVRWLHVLQGTDSQVPPDEAALLRSTSGTPYEGALVKDVAILFPRDLDAELSSLSYSVPASVQTHLITGLRPKAAYRATLENKAGSLMVTLEPGPGHNADEGGVLLIGQKPRAEKP